MVELKARPATRSFEIVRDLANLRRIVAGWRAAGDRIGVVPTMGALHDGHLALVRQARGDCKRVVVTLFVNPIQFDSGADLAGYPRDEERDAALLEDLGVDLLYAPDAGVIYPEGFATTVSVSGLTDCLCGATRPGHLTGVATVVAKLFTQVTPDVAYFGEKDYQQLLVVRRMASDLDLPVRVVGAPTVREADGLALSSRNFLLTRDARASASALYRVLRALADRLAGGREPAAPALASGWAALAAAGFEPIDYLDLRDAATLNHLDFADRPARVFGAGFLGPVRLIDNLPVG